MVLGAMAISIVLILFISWLALSLGEKLTSNISGLLPFALYMMKQRLLSKTIQILGVGLCAFLLLFTLMLLRDLGGSMQAYQRQHDGNLLVSQASSVQMADIDAWATTHNAEIRQRKPFMYATLTRINGLHLPDFSQKPSDSLATFQRPVRIHWSDAVPDNNRIVDGQWWQPGDENWQQVSVEQEVMTDLGLHPGDRLSFVIAGQHIDLVIVASHAYQPGAGSITFWLQMPRSALSHILAPQYYMASLELQSHQFSLLSQLWQAHPSLRMVSLKEMTQRFDTTLAMVTQVISGFAALIIILAGIVIVSSVHALEAKEKKKNSIIMSFGFSRSTCLKLNAIEWLVTGAIAASGAIAGTWAAGLLIYQSQFSMPYHPDFIWLLGTLSVILLVVASVGIAASKNSLSGSIRQLMAE
ncbi:ABC transporter permease [Lacimicrobium alkaliphilum]